MTWEAWATGGAAAALGALFALRLVPMPEAPPTHQRPASPAGQALQFQSGLGNADRVRQEFWVLPRPVATVPIRREPPTPAPPPMPPMPRALPVEPEPPRDVCGEHGGRRVEFLRHHHLMWRCAYRKHQRGG